MNKPLSNEQLPSTAEIQENVSRWISEYKDHPEDETLILSYAAILLKRLSKEIEHNGYWVPLAKLEAAEQTVQNAQKLLDKWRIEYANGAARAISNKCADELEATVGSK